jgi:hypothetical protein
LLEKQVGEAFGDLLFIASSQSNHCPWVEGFRWPSLRSGLLNPSTQGQIPSANQLSPFELAAVSFCSRPDSGFNANTKFHCHRAQKCYHKYPCFYD